VVLVCKAWRIVAMLSRNKVCRTSELLRPSMDNKTMAWCGAGGGEGRCTPCSTESVRGEGWGCVRFRSLSWQVKDWPVLQKVSKSNY
jgi:hypothetical protein